MKQTEDWLVKVKVAARSVRRASAQARSHALSVFADRLEASQDAILEANREDLAELPKGAADAFRDRLALDHTRVVAMAGSARELAASSDPVGEIVDESRRPNGLLVKRVRSPLGVVFMVFESRPNVAADAFALCLRAGNAVVLRGGSESARSCGELYRLMRESLAEAGLPAEAVTGIVDPDRALVHALLKRDDCIDLVVARGGESLIRTVTEHSTIPVMKHDRGLCSVYVDQAADLTMATSVVVNAKTSRPGVCNAAETLLVHEAVAEQFLPKVQSALAKQGVTLHADKKAVEIIGGREGVYAATGASFDTEYLDLEMSVAVVRSLHDAVAHIERHGSGHTEAIVTEDETAARTFIDSLDSAAVMWNASTRFDDGGELGLGAEIGISTQKLHARGPVGVRELTSVRWVVEGTGQTRT